MKKNGEKKQAQIHCRPKAKTLKIEKAEGSQDCCGI